VGNERANGLNRPAPPLVYVPMGNARNVTFIVRSSRVGTPGFVRELQQAVWSINPHVPLSNLRTVDDVQAHSMTQTSFATVMLALAGVVALVLGVVGIYGVVHYIAAQKTREIGIRMALGAQVVDVRRLFLRRGLVLTCTGIALGIFAAIILTRAMSALLFGVGPLDALTYVSASIVLITAATLATYLPARLASSIDPISTLRSDV
jgi:ABC-type antimicrobial peptide transport system permease subunit